MTWRTGGLLIALLVIGWSLYRLHLNPKIDYNMFDLLIYKGRADKFAHVMMGAFVIHSWIMISLQVTGKMTEGYLTIYGATWVAPLVAKFFAPKEKRR